MTATKKDKASVRYGMALQRLLNLTDYERMLGHEPPLRKYDLSRMLQLVERVGNPHRCAPVIHIGGTKGKGSVAAMITSILKASAYRVGLYTSPHLHTFRERIRIDACPLSETQFASLVEYLWPHIEDMNSKFTHSSVTTFELLTAMAFTQFQRSSVQVQVLEVGLGGRLDATNVADGAICVITPVSRDHTAILGNNLDEIAWEKAGIVKRKSFVVSAPQPEAVKQVIAQACRKREADLHVIGRGSTWHHLQHDLAGQTIAIETPSNRYSLRIPLLGIHQVENAATAITVAERLVDQGFHISPQAITMGLQNVSWPGRLEVLSANPLVVADGAHNAHSMKCLTQAIRDYFSYRRLILIFGCSNDKNPASMVRELAPITHHAILTQSRHPRALQTDQLSIPFQKWSIHTSHVPTVAAALESARAQAHARDMILVTGSLFVVAEAIQQLQGITGEMYTALKPYHTASGKTV